MHNLADGALLGMISAGIKSCAQSLLQHTPQEIYGELDKWMSTKHRQQALQKVQLALRAAELVSWLSSLLCIKCQSSNRSSVPVFAHSDRI